jgi:hypothetical protein
MHACHALGDLRTRVPDGMPPAQVERLRDRSGRLMNKRDSQRVAAIERDMSRWDEIQLLRSGVAVRVGEEDEEDDRERVMLVVSDARPSFLDGRQIFTKQMDPVLPLKDPTSDMAVVARRGSKLVMQVRTASLAAAAMHAVHACAMRCQRGCAVWATVATAA